MTMIFDGNEYAKNLEAELKKQLDAWGAKKPALKIEAISFPEDSGSALYSEIKKTVAARLGIEYVINDYDFREPLEDIVKKIEKLNADEAVTGIIVQKPRSQSYLDNFESEKSKADFQKWWQSLTMTIAPCKDVDGLTGKAAVEPATCVAVLKILNFYNLQPPQTMLIVGKSDLLGLPLYNKVKEMGFVTKLVGKKDFLNLQTAKEIGEFDIIVSATGVPNLIKSEDIKEEATLIDVGEPRGDVDFASCVDKAGIITPVPGGVGPLTAICLMQNLWQLWQTRELVR